MYRDSFSCIMKDTIQQREALHSTMKQLIFINGAMGVGKTAACRELLQLMKPAVYLDGDWCWYGSPFTVTEETKAMVRSNIVHLLRNFLACSTYETVIFCWVMHQQEIVDDLLQGLAGIDFAFHLFTLTASVQALTERLEKDIAKGERSSDIISRSVQRLPLYEKMASTKIDVSGISPKEASIRIKNLITQCCE